MPGLRIVVPRAADQRYLCDALLHHYCRCSSSISLSESEQDPTSVCLAAMVCDFMENDRDLDEGEEEEAEEDEEEEEYELARKAESMRGLIQSLLSQSSELETRLSRVLSSNSGFISEMDEKARRRAVVKQLRCMGYNAGICKSRWDYSAGIPAGDYEYIEVVEESSSERVIIDLDFRSHFEIARPTSLFSSILGFLPVNFVGSLDTVLRVVDLMLEAMKLSLKSKGLHLPPWRRPSYLKSKWLSTYKRANADADKRRLETIVAGPLPLQKIPVAQKKEACSEWQFPDLNPRAAAPQRPQKITGLTALF